MQMKEYRTVDKSEWEQRGEWDDEPDKVQWPDPATGFPCIARRSPGMGFWCGYVGVPEGHPDFGKDYSAVEADVHGGLTFAGACHADGDEASSICHVPDPGESDKIWWLGFDCGHYSDLSPGHEFPWPGLYRPLSYVREQVARLASQLAQRSQ